MNTAKPKVFVAGHRGMVGSAIVRALRARGDVDLLLCTRKELDLRDQRAVARMRSTSRRRRWAASTPTTPGVVISSTTT
jgi:GDP-L-fucose synthase